MGGGFSLVLYTVKKWESVQDYFRTLLIEVTDPGDSDLP